MATIAKMKRRETSNALVVYFRPRQPNVRDKIRRGSRIRDSSGNWALEPALEG